MQFSNLFIHSHNGGLIIRSMLKIHKQIRIYKPDSWLVSIGINKCLSVKVCMLLTWLQSSWKPFEVYIQDKSEQEIWF